MRNWGTGALATGVAVVSVALGGCGDSGGGQMPYDPDTADEATIDRFSAEAGNLFVRDNDSSLPAANAAVDFDANFLVTGLGPSGQVVQYYTLDVQPVKHADVFVLIREGESEPVAGQLVIFNQIPGDTGYNDIWRVAQVAVPADYVANTVASSMQIIDAGYTITPTTTLLNCPIVPKGSTALLRGGAGESTELERAWYRESIVYYFNFSEAALEVTASNEIPLSDVYVSWNINPDETGGGPPSGFRVETGTQQTHNVVETVPGDAAYSPLWDVNMYDNADFDSVSDLASAKNASILAPNAATVNCPIVSVGP